MTFPTVTKDYYEVLGVDVSATPALIVQSYKRRALELHPDRNPSPTATKDFQRLLQVYETLKDVYQRREYDRISHCARMTCPPPTMRGFNPTTTAPYPSPTATYPSPTAAYPSPTAAYPSPTAAYPSPTAARPSSTAEPNLEVPNEAAEIASIMQSKEARHAKWATRRGEIRAEMLALEKAISQLEQEIASLTDMDAAEPSVAEEASNTTTETKAFQDEEGRVRKHIERQERRAVLDTMKQRLAVLSKELLKKEEMQRNELTERLQADFRANAEIRRLEDQERKRTEREQTACNHQCPGCRQILLYKKFQCPACRLRVCPWCQTPIKRK